jgi:hypothetical protein
VRTHLHVRVEELIDTRLSAGKNQPAIFGTTIEMDETYPVVLLSRNTSFNAVINDKGIRQDYTEYYAAWVTPYAESVQEVIREAVSVGDLQMTGYRRP